MKKKTDRYYRTASVKSFGKEFVKDMRDKGWSNEKIWASTQMGSELKNIMFAETRYISDFEAKKRRKAARKCSKI